MQPTARFNDRWARLIGIPALTFTMALALKQQSPQFLSISFFSLAFFFELVVCFIYTFTIWEGSRWLFYYFRSLFPQYHQTRRRIFYQGAAMMGYLVVVVILLSELHFRLTGVDSPNDTFIAKFLRAFVPTVCVVMAYECAHFFEDWKRNVQKTEALARENVQSQLDALKNQLDPHFLFNSLNTLASLIGYEKTEAQQYLERLSDVYRYLLISRDKNTVSLAEEMTFLEAYVYLNKVRFRDNLNVVTAISPSAYQQEVAPLSLQMLVENAIKHNIVSKEKPLQIQITEDEDTYLSVVNNVQEKIIFEKSTKVGLQNICNRYQLLSDRLVEVIREDDAFKVRIPLLKPANG